MIDLHSHTNESDGSCTPLELVDRALAIGLEALGISDHDTFAGYDQAVEPARAYGLDLVCAIELSARLTGKLRTVHVLAYFVNAPPTPEFRDWVTALLTTRRERNIRLVAKLQQHDLGGAESSGLARQHMGRRGQLLLLRLSNSVYWRAPRVMKVFT